MGLSVVILCVALGVVSAFGPLPHGHGPPPHHGHPGHGHRFHPGHHGHPGHGCIPHRVTAGCVLQSDPGATSKITGSVHFTQIVNCHRHRSSVRVRIQAKGFTDKDDTLHGVHIHALPVNGSSCASAGGHYNPFNRKHADRIQPQGNHIPPEHLERHVGDLGNAAEVNNAINVRFNDHMISLLKRDGLRDIIGKSFVIHANRDDLGLGGNAGSTASGNAGARMACCTIKFRGRFNHIRHHAGDMKQYYVM